MEADHEARYGRPTKAVRAMMWGLAREVAKEEIVQRLLAESATEARRRGPGAGGPKAKPDLHEQRVMAVLSKANGELLTISDVQKRAGMKFRTASQALADLKRKGRVTCEEMGRKCGWRLVP
jgi:predicted Rossmann fold nucleotide-binding protein DprA/Smf involved in DNA uptake